MARAILSPTVQRAQFPSLCCWRFCFLSPHPLLRYITILHTVYTLAALKNYLPPRLIQQCCEFCDGNLKSTGPIASSLSPSPSPSDTQSQHLPPPPFSLMTTFPYFVVFIIFILLILAVYLYTPSCFESWAHKPESVLPFRFLSRGPGCPNLF